MDTGELIKKLRLQNHMTQEQLGKKLGVQKSAIAKYENGRVENLKRSTIQKMCEIFNVSPLIFFDNQIAQSESNDDITQYLKDKPDLLELYNELLANDQLTLLFDKTKDLTPQDVESVLLFVQTIRKQRGMEE